MVRRSACAAAILFVTSSCAFAEEIRLVTVGGLQRAMAPIAADFTKSSGHQVKITYTNPANLQKTLASEGPFDVAVVATSSVDELDTGGKLIAGTHVKMVRGGIAVAVKDGARKPDVSTPEALKATILAARNVVYTDPKTPNGSGEKTQKILAGLGLWETVLAKGKQESLGTGKELVAKGDYEIGFFNASEAEAPGCVIAGLVPASLQQFTTYDAAVLSSSAQKSAASAFVSYLAGDAAKPRWTSAYLERSN